MIRRLLAGIGLLLLAGNVAQADDLSALNQALHNTCPGAAVSALRQVPALDAAATAMADGQALDDALGAVRYRQESSMAATVTGKAAAPAAMERTARLFFKQFCQEFIDDGYAELGLHRSAERLFLVFAHPRHTITADDIPVLRAQLLELVNAARSQPRRCGERQFPAAGPLHFSDFLTKAAVIHAADMAQTNNLDHVGSDGSNPGERLTRAGYRWQLSGENLASGYDDVETVMRGWLDSPAHCENIMEARFDEMGLAFAIGPGPQAPVYWVQNFAAVRNPNFSRIADRH
jgi:uncharacterized protein YkwD